MVRFFKKSIPETPVVLSNNLALRFSTLDRITGYFASDDGFIQGELVKYITQMRYGLSEISAAEYTSEFLDKKKASPVVTSRKPWREEIAPNRIVMDTSSPRATPGQSAPTAPVVAGVEISDIRRGASVSELTTSAAKNLPDTKAEPPPAFSPPVGKRIRTQTE